MWRLSWEHWFAWRRKLNPAVSQHWQPPPKESLKVNIDVAIREEFGIIRVSFVALKQLESVL